MTIYIYIMQHTTSNDLMFWNTLKLENKLPKLYDTKKLLQCTKGYIIILKALNKLV